MDLVYLISYINYYNSIMRVLNSHCYGPSIGMLNIEFMYGCAEVWMTIWESGWNLWVWLVGVVSRRWVWLVGGIYGYGYLMVNLWVWLIFPTPLVLALFWQQRPYFFVHF